MTETGGEQPIIAPGALRASFATELPELAEPWESMRPEHPQLLVLNDSIARELGLDPDRLSSDEGTRLLLGNTLPTGARPVAQAYAGHQFGAYSPRLGDGRALLLGELRDEAGRRRDLHLKGSGPTPFARADGYAALGPMLRELLIAEAMHALGIPTTRALAVIATGRHVPRDGELEPGAILVRIASSHLRVGTFQYARARGDDDLLRRLADFAIERHHPEIEGPAPERYVALLTAVVTAQAELVAQWMHAGFVHGVMNTDNTTISGETIDYGPCAFIDAYDPTAVFSSIDRGGRYAYGAQPGVLHWNLTRLAEALLPLLASDPDSAVDVARTALDGFAPAYDRAWADGMRRKLGLTDTARATDAELRDIATGLLSDLHAHGIDFTGAFRALTDAAAGDRRAWEALTPASAGTHEWAGPWHDRWLKLHPDPAPMREANPVYIPRNHLVDEALAAAVDGDFSPFSRLLDLVTDPYTEVPGAQRFAGPDPSGRPFTSYCGT